MTESSKRHSSLVKTNVSHSVRPPSYPQWHCQMFSWNPSQTFSAYVFNCRDPKVVTVLDLCFHRHLYKSPVSIATVLMKYMHTTISTVRTCNLVPPHRLQWVKTEYCFLGTFSLKINSLLLENHSLALLQYCFPLVRQLILSKWYSAVCSFNLIQLINPQLRTVVLAQWLELQF